jgi:hypothetical protein
MARLYADEDFSYPTVEELRRLGHDVLTAHEASESNQGMPDSDVLAFAVARERAVVTFNRRHFVRLHGTAAAHLGIIVCSRDPDHVALAARVSREIAGYPNLANQLLRINRPP